MTNSFHRVNQSLRADRPIRSTLGVCIGLLLLTGWTTWAFRAHITRYEVSDSARLEADGAAYPVQASVGGRLVAFKLVLGRDVLAGEVLAEIESNDQKLNLEEERTRLASLAPQVAALRSQMESEGAGRAEEGRVLSVSTEEARAGYQEADAQAVLAEREAERATHLRAEGIIAEAEAQKAKAEARSKRAAAEDLEAAISRLEPENAVRERDRDVRLKQITGDIAKLEAQEAAYSASIKRLEYELDRRRIRAPISGRLSECAALRPGSHVSEGQQLGVILAPGKLHAVAEFLPSAAFGKIHPGQPALLRLDGFPWMQYGTVRGTVARVAGEVRDGNVRVELAVNAATRPRIPLQHGLPGSVEVEIEQVSPAVLVLRSAGQLVGTH